ncbi:MAG: hypothetical protein ACYDAY_02625 [Candidatus Dormibacteria bacterium]
MADRKDPRRGIAGPNLLGAPGEYGDGQGGSGALGAVRERLGSSAAAVLVTVLVIVVVAAAATGGYLLVSRLAGIGPLAQVSPSPSAMQVSPSPSETPSPTPEVSPTPAPSPSPSPVVAQCGSAAGQCTPGGTGAQCAARDVAVTVTTPQTSYASGKPITFTVTLRNNGRTTCHADVVGLQVQLYDSAGSPVQAQEGALVATRYSGDTQGYALQGGGSGFVSDDIDWSGHTADGGSPSGQMSAVGLWQHPLAQSPHYAFTVAGGAPSPAPSPQSSPTPSAHPTPTPTPTATTCPTVIPC